MNISNGTIINVSTNKGIAITSSIDDVIAAYGDPQDNQINSYGVKTLVYNIESSQEKTYELIFIIVDDKVSSISLKDKSYSEN